MHTKACAFIQSAFLLVCLYDLELLQADTNKKIEDIDASDIEWIAEEGHEGELGRAVSEHCHSLNTLNETFLICDVSRLWLLPGWIFWE